jgi:hypothetical protein
MRLLLLLVNLPLWADIAIVAGLIVLGLFLRSYVRRKFEQFTESIVLELGVALLHAHVTVHKVEAIAPPTGASPYDIDEDDENFMEGVDDEPWDDGESDFYLIDATIIPANPLARWDPTAIVLVPADHNPKDPGEMSHLLCPMHSAEIFANGQFRPAQEVEVIGEQRLRMRFAVHGGLRQVKFALFVNYFGHIDLPAPAPRTAART